MRRFEKFVTPWWLGGAGLAIVGVIFVRFVAPAFEATAQPAAQAAGRLVAIVGLIVIGWGIGRRVRSSPPT